MGVIYRAQDLRLGRNVAIKFISKDSRPGSAVSRSIHREAYAGSAVNHPNVCTVFDVGEFEERPFVVMELLEGNTLRQLIREPLRLDVFCDLAVQIASGLDAVHASGIVHRDIKPSNIFVTTAGRVKILDFGLAQAAEGAPQHQRYLRPLFCDDYTLPGTIGGTPAYMSPEQVLGLALDARADLFSLGVVFYEMLAAKRPFRGRTPSVVLNGVLRGSFVPIQKKRPSLPRAVADLIGKTLEIDREIRYQSAAELRWDLERLRSACGSKCLDSS